MLAASLIVFVVLQDVEELGRKLGFSMSQGNFHNVSLGQGQEVVAEEAMEKAAVSGQWVVLQVNLRLPRVIIVS